MSIGAIYYTDFNVDQGLMEICLGQLRSAFAGELVSVSLDRPLDLGANIVLKGLERSYSTMVTQIVAALGALKSDIVFFLEHDVLYHPSHFELRPERKDVFYYNINNYRWLRTEDWAVTYSGLTSLSMMFCDRKLALDHHQRRLDHIDEFGFYAIKSKEPKWGRLMGYEPGTKPRRRGGFSDDVHEKVRSRLPNIDIRHNMTFSRPKVRPEEFKHLPPDLRRVALVEIPGWDLKGIFGL